MCLISYNTKPLVLDRDLVVCKRIIKHNGYVTPYQQIPIKFGKVLKASGTLPELPEDYSENEIGEGCIHAYIIDPSDTYNYIKSVIKAGTPFYVSIDFKEIAARELCIGNSVISATEIKSELKETREILYNILREQNVINNVRVGDFLLSDKKTFTSKWTRDAIGFVAFIDDKIHVSAFNQGKCVYSLKLEECPIYIQDYPAAMYCSNYETKGTKKGDWYLPSSYEVLQMVRNKYFTNRVFPILIGYHYISSQSTGLSTVMGVHGQYACLCPNDFKFSYFYVRPFLKL